MDNTWTWLGLLLLGERSLQKHKTKSIIIEDIETTDFITIARDVSVIVNVVSEKVTYGKVPQKHQNYRTSTESEPIPKMVNMDGCNIQYSKLSLLIPSRKIFIIPN